MKKIFIIVGIIVVVLIASLLLIPTFFKGDILRIVQNQSSRYINAELKIGDMSLSMFKSFPSLNVALKEVTIAGKGEFAKDTVVYIPLFEASVNLKSLFSGDEIVMNRLLLKDCRLMPMVAVSGKANWDILIAGDTVVQEDTLKKTKDEKGEKSIRLNDIVVEGLFVSYNDFKNSTYASVGDVNLKLSGNFSETNTLVDVLLSLKDISFRHQNSVWVNKTDIRWEAEIGANLRDLAFDIKRNDLAVNDLKLDLTGGIAIKENKYDVDLQLNAPDTKFESLLTLVPKAMQHYIEGLKTTGEFKLNARVKGELYEGHLPTLEANLWINNASVKYPDLPESIRNIYIDVNVSNPGGLVDSTLLDVKKVAFNVAGNPFSMFLSVANPNDPQLNGGAAGVINFGSLKKALPLKDVTLEGMVTTDVTFKGKYQYIEKKEYEKFTAKGSVVFKDVLFVNAGFPQGISIPRGSVVITPARLNLNDLQAKLYSSDFTLQGSISNYLPYIFKNETLKGNFSLVSNQINLNEFIVAQMESAKKNAGEKVETDSTGAKPNASQGALEIPKNVDVQLTTNVNTIVFDQLTIRNVKGNVSMANGVATLRNLSMEMLNGSLVLNGEYSTANPKIPAVDFNLNASDFDVNAVYHSFGFIQKSLPIAMNCNGKVSAAMKFSAVLDKEMSPVMSTANGNGSLESKGILINDNPAMNQLANVLQNTELSRLSISQLKINFRMEKGNIVVEPFKTMLAGNPVTIYGNQSVDGTMDYTLSMNVNRKFFGKDINNVLKAIPGSNNIENLDIDVKVEGTLTKPVVKPDLSKAIKAVTKAAEKELKGSVLKGLQGLFKKK